MILSSSILLSIIVVLAATLIWRETRPKNKTITDTYVDHGYQQQGGKTKMHEREFETGMDESFKGNAARDNSGAAENQRLTFANMKRTYDEYQHESLESVRRNRSYVDKVLSDANTHDNVRQNLASQALQNAIETANMVSKQAVRHGDLAIDRQWNKEVAEATGEAELLRQVAISDAGVQAIAAAVAAAVVKALADND